MTRRWIAGLLLAGIANPTPTLAKEEAEPLSLSPSTPWKVDFADDNCSIARNFGTGDRLISVRLRRRGVTGGVDILLMGPLLPRFSSRPELNFTFEPQGVTQTVTPYSVKIPDADGYYLRGFKDEFVTAVQWSDSQIVRLTAANTLDVRMAWPGAKSAFAVLEQCEDDLQKDRGIDMAAIRAQRSRPVPIGSPGRWVANKDYPVEMMKMGGVGEIVFELVIDLEGKVSNCRNLMESGWKDLDTTVCDMLKRRARFTAATDADGQPTIGYYVNRVRFQIPR